MLFLNTGVYESADDALNEKAIMEHLRYQYDLKNRIANEVYIQHEFNKFRRFNVWALAGTGFQMIIIRKRILFSAFLPPIC